MSTRERVRKHREEMRAKGYKLIQLWVPDVSSPEYAAEVKRQAKMINRADQDSDIFEWLDSTRAE